MFLPDDEQFVILKFTKMIKSLKQKGYDYFFKTKTRIDIHSSAVKYVSKDCLRNFRVFSWLLMTLILIELLRVSSSFFLNVMFLSDQGFILTWLYFGLVVQDYWINSSLSQISISISPKIKYYAQLIFELALCLQVPITIIEWTLLFEEQSKTQSKEQVIVQVLEHSAPIILLLIDLVCNNYRFLTSRLILVIAYSLLYMAINLSYSLAIEPVYNIITWKDGQSYIYVVAVTLMIVGTHLLCGLIYRKFKQMEEQQNKNLVIQPKLSQRKSQRHMKNEQNHEDSVIND